MATVPSNPTQLTPPRVALIDERSGAISREWYRFFLSLLTATQSSQETADLSPETNAILTSYDAMAIKLAQATETQPQGASVNDVTVVQTQTQDVAVSVPPSDQSYLGVMQTSIQDLALAPRVELGTIATKNTGASGSFTAGAVTVTVVDGIITKIV
jgi:hypothetical protein